MKVLITGINGYIGSNLRKYLQNNGFEVYGVTSKESNDPKIFQADITNAQQIFNIINGIRPDIIVHTAAISSLKTCEENKQLAMKINVEATRNLVNSVIHINPDIKFIFLSSDYVFDGRRGSYKEDDPVNPMTFYGKTKALSEKDIKNNLKNYIICRTAAVFGRGGKFFNFIINALQQDKVIDVYEDAFFSPTYIDYLLDSLKELINIDFKGIIHITEGERISRYDFALLIAEILGKDKSLIRPIRLPENELIAKDIK
jgi:dTDP-4-dehydrorhamnose reductase